MQTEQKQSEPTSDAPYEAGSKILAVIGFIIIRSIASVCSAAVLMRVIFFATK